MTREQWKLVEEITWEEWDKISKARREEAEKKDAATLKKGPHLRAVTRIGTTLKQLAKFNKELADLGVAVRYRGYTPTYLLDSSPEVYYIDKGPHRKAYSEWFEKTNAALRRAVLEAKISSSGLEAKELLDTLRGIMKG